MQISQFVIDLFVVYFASAYPSFALGSEGAWWWWVKSRRVRESPRASIYPHTLIDYRSSSVPMCGLSSHELFLIAKSFLHPVTSSQSPHALNSIIYFTEIII